MESYFFNDDTSLTSYFFYVSSVPLSLSLSLSLSHFSFYPFRFALGLSGAVVCTSDYESSSIPDEGRRRKAHPAVHPPKRIGR